MAPGRDAAVATEVPPAAETQPRQSFLRVRTQLCENLTLPGLHKMLTEEQRPLLQTPVKAHDGYPACMVFLNLNTYLFLSPHSPWLS